MLHFNTKKQMRLLKSWKEHGNKDSLNLLIMSNSNLIRKEVYGFLKNNKNLNEDDLMQEGYLGLMIAVDKFDLSKDNNFVTYAVFWIRQRIKAYSMSNRSIVKIGTTADGRVIYGGMSKVLNKYKDKEMTEDEKVSVVSEELKVKKSSVRKMRGVLRGYDKSLEEPSAGAEEENQGHHHCVSLTTGSWEAYTTPHHLQFPPNEDLLQPSLEEPSGSKKRHQDRKSSIYV